MHFACVERPAMTIRALESVPHPVTAHRHARLWLFDFDNTLAALEREVNWAASRRELEAFLRSEGIGDSIFVEFPKGNILLYDALRARLMNAAVDGNYLGEALGCDSEALLRRASAIIEAHELGGVERAAPLPGAIALLRALVGRGHATTIVTSNSSITVKRWLQRHNVARCVSAIVGRDSLLALKPAPAMVVRALELNAVGPRDALFVGDTTADVAAARAAGLDFYGIAPSVDTRDRLVAAGVSELFESPGSLAAAFGLVNAPPGDQSG
jgi:phosphoglycolate phosphatase-like HAD superfamily hydrolase